MSYFNQESERLRFRQLTEEDISRWTVFFVDNDRLEYLGIPSYKSKEAMAEDWIKTQIVRYEEQGLGHLAVELKANGQLVGLGGILPRELDGQPEFEIAYSLIPEFWGKGYATEIARTMSDYGLRHIKTERFISMIHLENTASENVAKKNGMKVLFQTEFRGMQVNVYGFYMES